jgi:hypothetical protein
VKRLVDTDPLKLPAILLKVDDHEDSAIASKVKHDPIQFPPLGNDLLIYKKEPLSVEIDTLEVMRESAEGIHEQVSKEHLVEAVSLQLASIELDTEAPIAIEKVVPIIDSVGKSDDSSDTIRPSESTSSSIAPSPPIQSPVACLR